MKSFKYIIPLALGALMLNSCADELSGTEWSVGEVSSAPGIYFDPDIDPYFTLTASDDVAVDINVFRIDNKGSLTVPIQVLEADENMVIPSSVTFEDNSYMATIHVGCAAVERAVERPLSLTFPQEYINPYAAGGSSLESQVIISNWEKVTEGGVSFNILTWAMKDAGFQPIVSDMYHFVGSQRYRIDNFLNSGFDFNFELVQSTLQTSRYRIVPLSNQLLLADYGSSGYYNSWWLVADNWEEDEDNAWPELIFNYADGREMPYYYLEFLWYDEPTSYEYCYVENYKSGNITATMSFTGYLDADMEKYSPYYVLRFKWTEPR